MMPQSLELLLAVQLPGVKRHTRHVLGASGEELATLIGAYVRRVGEDREQLNADHDVLAVLGQSLRQLEAEDGGLAGNWREDAIAADPPTTLGSHIHC